MAALRALFVVLLMSSTAFAEGVNAVIGDDSWIARYGGAPDASADEDARLRVHLEYVEALLRGRVPEGQSAAQRAARAQNLTRLRAYIERGEFPRNREVQGRRPHFIDDDGRICAVGYLIEQTAGRATAEAINAKHEWDFIPEISGIEDWVAASGLTVEELAMIQPAYGWERPTPSPRPPPPPPDERTMQRRVIIAALASATHDVQRCADRFEVWSDVRVHVSLDYRGSSSVFVPRVGSRSFQRCVHNKIATALASRKRMRGLPMTVAHTFTIDADARDDGRFAQPPPR